ncbi:MAG: FAD-dependent oxidoreductase [Patescibacteria group bacterium]|nr:FAD-dependent oxidoreductase [Patescibacteria group bacterium]MDE2588264.1 FAD-dependent oxidoreductase [Patescibacteria group bacterium]
MTSQVFSLPFVKKESAAKETWSYFFDRTNVSYDFQPGQYNRVTLPITAMDTRGNSRMFTIASSPTDKDVLMITTKRGISDFKNAFFTLEAGMQVQFFGPLGGFVLPEEDPTPRILLARGIGITPFHSMLRYAGEKNISISLTLIASFSTVEEMIYYEELTNLAKLHPNLKIVYTVTRPEESKNSWEGEKGRISPEMIKKYVADTISPFYMISGPPAFVDGTVDALQTSLSIAEEKIKVDQFTGY